MIELFIPGIAVDMCMQLGGGLNRNQTAAIIGRCTISKPHLIAR